MSGKITLTLVIAFLLAVFSIFNTAIVEINLMVRTFSMPISLLIFIVFFIGAVYAGFLAFFDQIQHSLLVRKLKKRILIQKKEIMDLEDALAGEAPVRAPTRKIPKVKPVEESNPFEDPNPFDEGLVPDDQEAVEEPENDASQGKVYPFLKKEKEGGLSEEELKIAMKRIENGD